MPRSKTGFKKRSIQKEDTEIAVQLIVNNEVTIYRASKDFDILETTLRGHRNQFLESGLEKYCYKKKNDVKQFFTVEDKLLADCILRAADLQYGLILRNIQKLAYQFGKAEKKSIMDLG